MVTKVNAMNTKILNTSGLITKKQYDSDKQGFEKNIEDVDNKIPNTSGLVKKKKIITQKLQHKSYRD